MLLLFLCGFQTIDKTRLCGHYENINGFLSYNLTLKENGTYTEYQGSYTVGIENEGKWELHKNTIVLTVKTRKDLRDNNRIVKIEKDAKMTEKLLVRSDTLFYLNDDNSIDDRFLLVKQKR